MLFDDIIFGPLHSRRLGTSLGVNLMPTNAKLCSFDCIYCECGFNFTNKDSSRPTREEVKRDLAKKLKEYHANGKHIDVITFAGNGEPTMHPHFAEIIDDTIEVRNQYFPEAKISVLSNATMIYKPDVFAALNKIDNNILKIDSVVPETYKLINQPYSKYSLADTIENMKKFKGNFILQTMFLRGEHNGVKFDNTSDKEVEAWLKVVKDIQPKEVMLYSIDRDTPVKTLVKIHFDELSQIAKKVEALGIKTLVTP